MLIHVNISGIAPARADIWRSGPSARGCRCSESRELVVPIPRHWQENGVGEAKSVQRARLWVCVYPTRKVSPKGNNAELSTLVYDPIEATFDRRPNRISEQIKHLNTRSSSCGRRLFKTYRPCERSTKRKANSEESPFFSNDCVWKRIEVTSIVKEAISRGQSNITFFNRLQMKDCINSLAQRECFSFLGNGETVSARHSPFLELRYNLWFHFATVKKAGNPHAGRSGNKLVDLVLKNVGTCGVRNATLQLADGVSKVIGAHDTQHSSTQHHYQYCHGVCGGTPSLAQVIDGTDYADSSCKPVFSPNPLMVTIMKDFGPTNTVSAQFRQNTVVSCACVRPDGTSRGCNSA